MEQKTSEGQFELSASLRRTEVPFIAPPEPPGIPGLGRAGQVPEFPRFRPRWLGRFVGRELLRVCPEATKPDPCVGCSLMVFCRCAQADFAESQRVERRVWLVIAASAAGVLGYAALTVLH